MVNYFKILQIMVKLMVNYFKILQIMITLMVKSIINQYFNYNYHHYLHLIKFKNIFYPIQQYMQFN